MKFKTLPTELSTKEADQYKTWKLIKGYVSANFGYNPESPIEVYPNYKTWEARGRTITIYPPRLSDCRKFRLAYVSYGSSTYSLEELSIFTSGIKAAIRVAKKMNKEYTDLLDEAINWEVE